MKRPLLLSCLLLATWPCAAPAGYWQPSATEDPPSLGDDASLSGEDLGWVFDDNSPEPPDAGVDGAEEDPYDSLDPTPTPPPGPSGGGGPIPVPEPMDAWLVGAAWLVLRRRKGSARA